MQGRQLKISLYCIHAHKTDFAKGFVLLLRVRFQVDCCWIRSEKDKCGHLSLQDGFGNVLFDPLLPPLGSMAHVRTIALAQELAHDVAVMRSK